MASNSASKTVLYTAIAGNLLVAATKFGAAIFTGSAAMLSEGVHSVVDSGNEVLPLYGLRRSTLPPDTEHPLGYGREIYFWSFVVALLIFALGAGVSILEGILRILEPEPIESPMVSYVVLALSAVFEGPRGSSPCDGSNPSVASKALSRRYAKARTLPRSRCSSRTAPR